MRRSIRTLSAGAAVCLVLAACGAPATTPSASQSLSPSPSPAAAIEFSPSASAAPMSSAETSGSVPGDSVPIPPDTYARVVTNDLRVRSKPGVSEDSKKLEPLLQKGVRVVVLDGPVQASGYDWYLVQPTIPRATAVQYPFGWVAAAGKDGEPWLESTNPECPPLPASVEQMGELKQAAHVPRDRLLRRDRTYASRPESAFPRPSAGPSRLGCRTRVARPCRSSGAPEFLSVDPPYGLASPAGLGAWCRHGAWRAPDVGRPEDWPIVEVKGKFDHPDARSCRNRLNYEGSDGPNPIRR